MKRPSSPGARLLVVLLAIIINLPSIGCCILIPLPFSNQSALSGLHVGTESRQDFNPATGYYDYKVRQIYYLFFPDGRVYRGLPKGGGLSNFNFEQAQNQDAINCGSYKVNGNKIEFTWPGVEGNGSSQILDFSSNQKSVQIGKTTFYSVGTFDNLQLEGVYSVGSFTNTSNRSGGTEGGVGSEQAIFFGSDGSFKERGFVGYAGSSEDAGSASSETSSGSGSYKITANTLELNYSDGRSQRYTFFVYPENVGETRPALIVIDGKAFLLRQ